MRWFQIQAKAKDAAEVLIYDRIGKGWDGNGIGAKDFNESLKALGDVNNITLRINSPGGNVFDGVAVHNMLVNHKASITVHVDGIAASIASVIAMAGDKIIMPSNAMMMIHNPSGGVLGTAGDMRKMANTLDRVGESLVTSYTDRTRLSRDKIKAMMEAETWMSAQEARDLGFADEVAEPVQMAASYDLSAYKNAPRSFSNQHSPSEARKVDFDFDSLKGMDEASAERVAKDAWKTDAKVREEFATEAAFVAYAKACARGLSRIYKK